jgi:hypothetical protein
MSSSPLNAGAYVADTRSALYQLENDESECVLNPRNNPKDVGCNRRGQLEGKVKGSSNADADCEADVGPGP